MAIAPCSCGHEYQNKKYGAGQRVHNMKKNGQLSCTVCGKTNGTATGAAAPVKKAKK